ncbi:MAG: tetratricopeptide repeat protein [Deltaproteobacteria bacterium]|nr:tetratricopeptide repeat protein [Deltaproteobacteria bacterium]
MALTFAASLGGATPALAQADVSSESKPSQQDREQAVALFERSAKAYQEGNFEEAASYLRTAYLLDPAPILLYNLAKALEGAGRLEESKAAFEKYLEREPDTPDRKGIERRIATLTIQIEERAALEKLKAERARLLTQPPPPTPAPPPPTEPPAPSVVVATPAPEAPTRVAPWIIVGVGAAGVAAGGVLGYLSSQRTRMAEDEPTHSKASDLVQRADTFALGANIAYGVGGAALLGGLVWAIFGGGDDDDAQVQALLTPDAVGLQAQLRL